MLIQFIQTVFYLVKDGRWTELNRYFDLISEILNAPTAVITVGEPILKGI